MIKRINNQASMAIYLRDEMIDKWIAILINNQLVFICEMNSKYEKYN